MKGLIIGTIALLVLNQSTDPMKNANETVIRLFNATDQRDWNAVKETFSTKVLLDYSSMTGNPATDLSPEQIVAAWQGILPGFEYTHHQLGNFETTIDRDKATVFCYGTADHYLSDKDGNLWTVVGSYDFDLLKDSSGTWKIAGMKFNFKYQYGNTVLPQKAMNKLK